MWSRHDEVKVTALRYARWDLSRQKARDLTAKYTSPPVPVVEIAETAGVEVVFADFGPNSSSIAGFCDFEDKQIVVNDDDNFGRKMFTIAHELGHWILHKQFFEENPRDYSVLPRLQRPEKNPFEQEANCFAAELLVPAHLLLPVKSAGAATLASIFHVSRDMMENRLKNV